MHTQYRSVDYTQLTWNWSNENFCLSSTQIESLSRG